MRPQFTPAAVVGGPEGWPMAVFEFGPFVLDPAKRFLLRDGVPQSLTPKAFDVLTLLVQHRERVVSKDELLSSLWPGTFVEEANLSQQIFVLRRTLNGNSESTDYITTTPRRGYRFTADVVERSENDRPQATIFETTPTSRRGWSLRVLSLAAGLTAGGVLLAATLLSSRNSAVDSEPHIRRVTALPGLEQFPSISPDGNFVVFSWSGTNPAAAPDLWIKAIDGDVMRRLTETPEAEVYPAWSPDGRDIAFVRGSAGVFIVSALGGPERHVFGSGSIVGWTPDSRSLLVRDRTNEGPHGILRIELATGARHQVTQAPSGIGDWTFDVSRDGQSLAFVRYERPGIGTIHTVPIAGGEPRRLTDWTAISHVAWSPDGRHILYSVDDDVFRIAADSTRIERGHKVLHTSGVGLSMSRPGTGRPGRLAFTEKRTDVGLRLIDLDGARGDVLKSDSRFADSTRVDVPGRFSRNGKQVAFASDRTGQAEAWVANADGSDVRQLTSLQATELIVGDWSPDNRHLVIDAAIEGNSDIYVISLDSRVPVRLTTEPVYDGFPEWSADGRWIYFTSLRSGRPEVWKVSVDGGEPIQFTHGGGLQLRQSPDGQTLFYLDRPPYGTPYGSRTSRLMSIPASGGEEVPLTDGLRLHLWSPVQDGIVFVSLGPDADAIDLYRFSDGTVQRLGTLPFRVSRIAELGKMTVSRDGRWALVSTTDVWESDIMVADGVR
jgi:Tol biopolymer transport system component/DNA-binding winged helix-turn-helix (wHTH) protein